MVTAMISPLTIFHRLVGVAVVAAALVAATKLRLNQTISTSLVL
jgi:hypothetical protein